jgi:hypothetical protein
MLCVSSAAARNPSVVVLFALRSGSVALWSYLMWTNASSPPATRSTRCAGEHGLGGVSRARSGDDTQRASTRPLPARTREWGHHHGYIGDLRSNTQGRGQFTMDRHELIPRPLLRTPPRRNGRPLDQGVPLAHRPRRPRTTLPAPGTLFQRHMPLWNTREKPTPILRHMPIWNTQSAKGPAEPP